MFKGISFATWGLMNLSIEESIIKVAGLGFSGIEFWTSAPHDMLALDRAAIKRVGKLVNEHGLQSVSMCPNYTHEWWKADVGVKPTTTPDEYVRLMKRNMNIAADLGCEKCNIHSMNIPISVDERTAWKNLVHSFKECATFAKNLGLVLCHEPEPGMAFGKLRDVLRILKEVDAENFGICFDTTLAYVLSDGKPKSFLESLGGRITHVHLSDQDESIYKLNSSMRATTSDLLHGRVPLGKGRLNNGEIVKGLTKAGYKNWITVEPAGITDRREESAKIGLDLVSSLIAQVRK